MTQINPSVLTLGLLLLISACSASENSSAIRGIYQVESYGVYRGGLTTEEDARKQVGDRAIICPDTFRYAELSVQDPHYQTRVLVPDDEEGVTSPPLKKTTWFWGIHPERKSVRLLDVKSHKQAQFPSVSFEVLDQNHLVNAFDGIAFFLTRVGSCEDSTK
ncbi:MAG: hypothetical protein D6758_06725 [Gammaproteobacteria bacterium]|nr:MAG: hypothetical protein D6758_06725 [Gammaproteobacteria bacterium]